MDSKFWKQYLIDYDHVVLNSFSYNQMLEDIVKVVEKYSKRYKRNELKILDAGCGTGNFISKAIVLLGTTIKLNILGIDNDSIALSIARRKNNLSSINFLRVDLNNNFIKLDEKYDIIICLSVIWDIENLSKLIQNFSSISHPKSLLVVTYPTRNSNRGRILFNDLIHGLFLKILAKPSLMRYFIRSTNKRHFNDSLKRFHKAKFEEIVTNLGFRIDHISTTYSRQFQLVLASKI